MAVRNISRQGNMSIKYIPFSRNYLLERERTVVLEVCLGNVVGYVYDQNLYSNQNRKALKTQHLHFFIEE